MHEPAKSYVKRCRDTKDGRAAYFKLKEEICSSIPISVADLGVRNGNRDWRADLVFKPEKRRSPILGVLIPWYASHRHNDCQAVRPRGSGSLEQEKRRAEHRLSEVNRANKLHHAGHSTPSSSKN
eukprot:1195107-Prorocentrum_minimum.AAC.1